MLHKLHCTDDNHCDGGARMMMNMIMKKMMKMMKKMMKMMMKKMMKTMKNYDEFY